MGSVTAVPDSALSLYSHLPEGVSPGRFALGLLAPADVCILLGVTDRTLWKWRRSRVNPLVFYNTSPGSKTLLISREDLLAWLRKNRETPRTLALRKSRIQKARSCIGKTTETTARRTRSA